MEATNPNPERAVLDSVTVPDGEYLCHVAEVRGGSTSAGDERWALRLVVNKGPHAGKQAAWDSMVFSVRGRARARSVLKALQIPALGRVQVTPKDVEGRVALVTVKACEFTAPAGHVVRRSEVPWDGWKAAQGGES